MKQKFNSKILLFTGIISLLPVSITLAQCTTTNATSCVCETPGQTNCDLLPDIIVARPPLLVNGATGIIEYSQSGNGANDGRLRISVSTPNIGHGPLEVRATSTYICGTDTINGTAPATCPNTGLPPRQLLKQRVYQKSGTTMNFIDRDAGSMTYHPTHGHMHVDDWGVFTLRTQTSDPNPLNWPIVGNGAKLAFCLMDYGSCSTYGGHCVDSLGNTLLNGNFPNYGLGGGSYNCSATVQGISSGYTDIYYQSLDGMWIDIPPGTCNGDYYIVVQLDPYNYFMEENENNNVLAVPYTLTQQVLAANATIIPSISGPVCSGTGVTLSANTGTGFTYLWSNGATTPTINVNTAGAYTVDVTTPCGVASSSPYNVTFSDIPPQTSNANICSQNVATLSANAGGGIIEWFTTPSGGSPVGSGNVFVTPPLSSSTTYYAQATTTTPAFSGFCQPAANTIGGGGYLTSSQYQIFDVFQSLTLASVKVYAQTATATTIELRNSANTLLQTINVNVPSGESRVNLNWSITPGTGYRLTRAGSAALYRNNAGVSYPYTIPNYLSITGSSAGSAFYYFFYDWEITKPAQVCFSSRVPATVNVYPNPVVTFAALSAVCSTDQGFLLTGGSPAGGTYSGTGVNNGFFNPGAAGVGTHTLTYSYSDANGCPGSSTQTITVNNCGCPPPAQTSSIQGPAKVCTGSTLSYQVINNVNVTYNWVPPAGAQIVSGQGTNAIQLAFGSSYTSGDLCVTAVDACGISVARCKTLTKHVAARPAQILGERGGHCNTTNGSLYVNPVGFAVSYNWTVPAGVTITGGQGTPSITFSTSPGFSSGDVCVTTNNGCMNSQSRCAKIFATPDKPAISGPASVCAGQTGVTYTATPEYGATSYTWFVPSGASIVSGQGSTNLVMNFGNNGGQVQVAAKNTCGKRGNTKISVTINCRVAQHRDIEVFPNPASDYVELAFTSEIAGKASVQLLDLSGRLVHLQDLEVVEGHNAATLDISELSSGVYLMNLVQDQSVSRIKIMVE